MTDIIGYLAMARELVAGSRCFLAQAPDWAGVLCFCS